MLTQGARRVNIRRMTQGLVERKVLAHEGQGKPYFPGPEWPPELVLPNATSRSGS